MLTWLHRSDRHVLRVHPRGDPANPMQGVFSTRSPARPNPIGVHRVRVLALDASFTPSHRGGSGPPLVCLHGFTETGEIGDVPPTRSSARWTKAGFATAQLILGFTSR